MEHVDPNCVSLVMFKISLLIGYSVIFLADSCSFSSTTCTDYSHSTNFFVTSNSSCFLSTTCTDHSYNTNFFNTSDLNSISPTTCLDHNFTTSISNGAFGPHN